MPRHIRELADARPSAQKLGFLYLRRYPGERIVLLDRRALTWLTVLEIDLDEQTALLQISGREDPFSMERFAEVPILQGDGILRLAEIVEYRDGRAYASLGLRAPRSVVIRREELIRGLDREELLQLASG